MFGRAVVTVGLAVLLVGGCKAGAELQVAPAASATIDTSLMEALLTKIEANTSATAASAAATCENIAILAKAAVALPNGEAPYWADAAVTCP
jgi:uncharacterized protein YcfL